MSRAAIGPVALRPPLAISDNARSAVFMSLAMFCYVVNDTAVKLAAETLGVFQVVALRGVVVVGALSIWVARKRYGRRDLWPLPASVWLRVACEMAATVCFLLALTHMNIGDLTAIMQFVPLGITLVAAVALGERVRWPRYVAVVGGFVGVMMIIRPGSSRFSVYAILALGAVAAVIVRDLLTRRIPATVPSLVVTLATAIGAWLLGVAAVVGGAEWNPITLGSLALVGVAAIAIVGGLMFSVMTVRVGDLSFASPFRYTGVVWALLSQVVFFAVIPDTTSILGAVLIVSMGLFAMYRDRRYPAVAGTTSSGAVKRPMPNRWGSGR